MRNHGIAAHCSPTHQSERELLPKRPCCTFCCTAKGRQTTGGKGQAHGRKAGGGGGSCTVLGVGKRRAEGAAAGVWRWESSRQYMGQGHWG